MHTRPSRFRFLPRGWVGVPPPLPYVWVPRAPSIPWLSQQKPRYQGGAPLSFSTLEFGNPSHEVVTVIQIVMRVFDIAELPQSSVYVVDLCSYLDFGEFSRENAPAIARVLMDVHRLMRLIKWVMTQAEAGSDPRRSLRCGSPRPPATSCPPSRRTRVHHQGLRDVRSPPALHTFSTVCRIILE